MVKARVVYNSGSVWERFYPEQIKRVIFTPSAYFNIELVSGEIFSADKLDVTEQ